MTKVKSYIYPLTLIGIIFFAFGFLTWINGILIPYFKICLELTNFESTWVAFASYTAYFVMAIPSSFVLKYTGYKKGISLGLLVMAIGTLLFIPAAYARSYTLFLTGLFVTGSGLTLSQAAANPYIALIGPIESHAQRIGFMGIANKLAAIVSVSVFGSIFLFGADAIVKNVGGASVSEKNKILGSYILKVIPPYLVVSGIILIIALIIMYSKLPEVTENATENSTTDKNRIFNVSNKSSVFKYPHLVLGVISLFCAGACEVIPIDGIIIYSNSLGIPIEQSRHFPKYTLYAMIIGYLSSIIIIPKYLSQSKALMFCSIWGIVLTIISYFNEGLLSVYCLMLMGFGTAFLWGTIWGLSLRKLGKYTKLGSALLLMSVIGGGIFPLIFGRLIDINTSHTQNALLLLLPCYLVLFMFSTWGYHLEDWKSIKVFKYGLKNFYH